MKLKLWIKKTNNRFIEKIEIRIKDQKKEEEIDDRKNEKEIGIKTYGPI